MVNNAQVSGFIDKKVVVKDIMPSKVMILSILQSILLSVNPVD